MDENTKIARAATTAGVILLESGAETYRVEDTMRRICLAYGAEVVDSFVTPTVLIISFSKNQELMHNVKRTQIKSVDLQKIDRVNSLSRHILSADISVDSLMVQLEEIQKEKRYTNLNEIVAAAICCFGFSMFFHGTLRDAICAMIAGSITHVFTQKLAQVELDGFFSKVIGGAIVTILGILSSRLGLCSDMNNVIISTIMLLVPGLAFTNAIRDTVSGDLLSGLSRIVEALLTAVALAVGSGLVFMLLGGY